MDLLFPPQLNPPSLRINCALKSRYPFILCYKYSILSLQVLNVAITKGKPLLDIVSIFRELFQTKRVCYVVSDDFVVVLLNFFLCYVGGFIRSQT